MSGAGSFRVPGLVSFLFFCTGALGLVYEIVWQRQFALLFGSAAPATAAVLAAYFAGLGIGSFIAGKYVNRWRNPLVIYGALEIIVAAGVLLSLALLDAVGKSYSGIAPSLMLKLLLAFVSIAIPTIAMGGTLPVLGEFIDARKEQIGVRVGWLYLVNTAGAALGALIVPFLLLPVFGMTTTALACAGTSAAIGMTAIAVGRRSSARTIQTNAIGGKAPLRYVTLAFVSGAGIFALQVLWNRAFSQLHENSIFSFAWLTALFIIAIAAGAHASRIVLKRGLNSGTAHAVLWLAGGFVTMFAPQAFIGLTRLEYIAGGGVYLMPRTIIVVLLVIVLPIVLLSAALPIIFDNAAKRSGQSTASLTGTLLAANILGCIGGALCAGFVMPSAVGLWRSVIATGSVFVIFGILLLSKVRLFRLVLCAIATVLVLISWQLPVPRTRVDAARGEQLLALAEGAHGIVAVVERAGSRRLKLNNHYVLGGTASTGDERMQAHIPLILAGGKARAAFLGYGTGITAGGTLKHEGVNATAIELVPEVVNFAARFFNEANLGFGQNDRSKVIIDDARNYLRSGRDRFDVIVSDLVVPWRPGEAGLYTAEHFRAMNRSLNSNGLPCVWVPLFQLAEREFNVLLHTFITEFGPVMLWRGDFSPTDPAVALIPFNAAPRNRVSDYLQTWPGDPLNPQLRYPEAFWMHFVGRVELSDIPASDRLINSEVHPLIELGSLAGDHGTKRPLVGRDLQRWELSARERSFNLFQEPGFDAGRAAGALMVEYTLLLKENNHAAATRVQQQIRTLLSAAAAAAIFGGTPQPNSR